MPAPLPAPSGTATRRGQFSFLRVRHRWILWVALSFNFLQLTFSLIYIPLLGAGAVADFTSSILGSLGNFGHFTTLGASLLLQLGADFTGEAIAGAAVGLWIVTAAFAGIGFFTIGLIFMFHGKIHALSGENSGTKWALFIVGWIADVAFPINGLLFGLTLWVWYVLKHPA